jgi:hypothetical protein
LAFRSAKNSSLDFLGARESGLSAFFSSSCSFSCSKLLLLLCVLTSSLHAVFSRWRATYNLLSSLCLRSFSRRRETMLTSPLPNLTLAALFAFRSCRHRVNSSGKTPKRRRSWSIVPTNSATSARYIRQRHLIHSPCVSSEHADNSSSPIQSFHSNLNHQFFAISFVRITNLDYTNLSNYICQHVYKALTLGLDECHNLTYDIRRGEVQTRGTA